MEYREEHDGLGTLNVPADAYWGIHTARALENFAVSGYRWPRGFITGLAWVKLACARTNLELGYLGEIPGRVIIRACEEMVRGQWHRQIVVDPFQGGAGTSTNMNMNEVIANRAIELLGGSLGDYSRVHPLDHVNMHQSTNDVFPTGLKVAVMFLLKDLEQAAARLQESLQSREHAFRDVVKVGRTQLQDAVPVTLGMSFGAYAEAVARDRWRVFKCRERIKQINLGGTAVGTGIGAPRQYIFNASTTLRNLTGLNVSRCENLVDATQNLDPFVEVSGMLKAFAANLLKISNDLRLMASGPDAGLGEIHLPAVQAGSSIMPGKVNPVIPEMTAQVALQVMANDQAITSAAALGNLELNQFFPLVAWNILQSLELLTHAAGLFRERCIDGITPDEARCFRTVMAGKIVGTVLVPALGYEAVEKAVKHALAEQISVVDALVTLKIVDREKIIDIMSPRRMYKLGFDPSDFDGLVPSPESD
ncbi:MAG TPA: aspartate ammonia-lyase [bacterium]|nr:aspartate ammonia-lyase [bacterium]